MAQQGPARPPQNQPSPLAIVFNVERANAADLVLLSNGDRLTGKLLNDTVSLRTTYARLEFESRMVAGIELEGDSRGVDSILTVNSNRFSGILETTVFHFELEAGNRIEMRREKVSKLVLRLRETDGIPRSQWIRLRNGDQFSGELLTETLPLTIDGARMQVPLKEVISLTFAQDKDPVVRIIRRDGEPLQGTLELEDVPIQLDAGPRIQLYRGRIDIISEVPTAAAEGGKDRTPASVGLATASTNRTNLDGMVWIPAGEFAMGSPTDELGRDQDEGPLTQVIIPHGFWIGRCEVTQAEYQAVMKANPSHQTGDSTQPVEKVNWHEAIDYCHRLTQMAQIAGKMPEGFGYRLPTEAEWEYACRAGTRTPFSHGDDKNFARLVDYAWFTGNGDSTTHSVGTLKPNPWGLHDVHGNVWEWCLDRWQGFLPGGAITNSPGLAEGSLRVARGGSWLYDGKACRSANRDDYSPSNRCSDLGFRVVLAPIQP